MTCSTTHVVILPSYNSGPGLCAVVAEVLRCWQPVIVVIDGSTDGSDAPLVELARGEAALSLVRLGRNSGKGAAVLAGARAARERGFTHALVMDADGQHPAASIAEFMTASLRRPEMLVLGRPQFPPNIPPERLHGRKLSVGMVRLELLGAGIDDPLFGFRVYPLEPLLRVLGPRRSGRRYDFDTEAAVRLAWEGVPPINLAAPVRYFSAAEGGISHFHYVRDNLTLVWMHTRLLTELLLWRWWRLRGHRRRWNAAVLAGGVLLLGLATMPAVRAQETIGTTSPVHAQSAEWLELGEKFAQRGDVHTTFVERRFFPFKKQPLVLEGDVRVSTERGLSLHYTAPEERIVILDAKGVLIRDRSGERAPPADARADGANRALLHILRFDLAALGETFELRGSREEARWVLVLTPRTEAMRRSVGRIIVSGEKAAVHRIELRRSARQSIEIVMAAPREPAPFTPAELQRFFR